MSLKDLLEYIKNSSVKKNKTFNLSVYKKKNMCVCICTLPFVVNTRSVFYTAKKKKKKRKSKPGINGGSMAGRIVSSLAEYVVQHHSDYLCHSQFSCPCRSTISKEVTGKARKSSQQVKVTRFVRHKNSYNTA